MATSAVKPDEHFLVCLGATIIGDAWGPEGLLKLLGLYQNRLTPGRAFSILSVDTGRAALLTKEDVWDD